jgi:hypothetical protein
LAHPEVISMVASALGGAKPSADGASKDASDEDARSVSAPPSPSPDALATLSPLLSGLSALKGGDQKHSDDPKACLLRALKPYVSPARREAIDTMIRLSALSSLLGKMI